MTNSRQSIKHPEVFKASLNYFFSEDESRLRPVVIFLEGQLFTLGNPADVPAQDFVSSQDLVFVSLSYRLNAFGFLSWEDERIPGNIGLQDQYLAILWVYENISKWHY